MSRFERGAKTNIAPSFGSSLAETLDWDSKEKLTRMEQVQKKGISFRLIKACVGEQPALLFVSHKRKNNSSALKSAALCAYHSTIEWGVLTNFAETVVFNSHWIKDREWFCLPTLKAGDISRKTEVFEALTPDGLREGRIDALAISYGQPDSVLLPVDEQLVDLLDGWRDDALKYSSSVKNIDRKLQHLFAQFFVLRAVEDRNLAPTVPRLETAISDKGEVDRDRLTNIFKEAKSTIQSELFEGHIPRDIPGFVIAGIIRDLYQPRDFPVEDVRYNFAWIEADILGRAYEKYLSTVLIPAKKSDPQLSLFEAAFRDVRRVSRRKAGGVYYTPEFVVRYLTEKSLDAYFEARSNGKKVNLPRIADISCGSGSFLRTAADSLIRRLCTSVRRKNWGKQLVSKQVLTGIDVDPRAVTLARLSLWLRLAEEPNPLPLPRLSQTIVCGDSLSSGVWKSLPDKYDIILGNPPFLPTPHVAYRMRLANSFRAARGRFDYSSLFVEKAIRKLKKDGLLGMVIPNRLFHNYYAAPIREFISEETKLLTLVDFGSTEVFVGTSTYVALLTAKKRKGKKLSERVRIVHVRDLPSRFPGVVLLLGDTVPAALRTPEIKAYDARHPQGPRWILLSDRALGAKIVLENDGQPLETLAAVVQGIKTGANDIFVVNIQGSHATSLVRIINGFGEDHIIEKDLLRPVVYGAEIARYDTIAAYRFLIYPYFKGKVIDERHLKKEYPNSYKYLIRYRNFLELRSGIKNTSYAWYELVRKRKESWLNSQKLVIRDLAMEPAFAIDRHGGTFLIGGVAVVPADPILLEPLLAFLNSAISAWYLGQVSSPYRGGYSKFEPKNVERIPIPSCVTTPSAFRGKIVRLVERLIQARLQDDESLPRHIEEDIDQSLLKQMGMPLEEIL